MTANKVSGTLKDVVAFVDVWSSSKTENYSKPFMEQLQEMGAVVSKRFDKRVTHVVFKNGHRSTWNKAKKTGVKLVSVFWVARCKEFDEHIDEELCPAINEESSISLALNKRTHRCMQPRDIPNKTPENDRSMKRKLGQMIKDLAVSLPSSPGASPFFVVVDDDSGGAVCSPTSGSAACMAQRLKVMRERRESLLQTEDDSDDVDAPFRDCHGCTASDRREGEDQRPKFDLDACESSNGERNRDGTESIPETGAEKRRKVIRNDDGAKVKTFDGLCPELGLLGESKRAKSRKASVQRNGVERQASIGSPCLDLLFGERTVSQSLLGHDGRDIKKPRKSSFKSSQSDEAGTQSPSLTKLFGENKVTKSRVESEKVVNVHEDDRTVPTKARFSFGECGKSVSPSLTGSGSLARDSLAAYRRWGNHQTAQASPLKLFSRRKSSLLAPGAPGSPESFRRSPPGGDGVFDSYFSPANRPDCGRRRLPPLSSLPPEANPLPAFQLEPKAPKRKRARSETDGPGRGPGERRSAAGPGASAGELPAASEGGVSVERFEVRVPWSWRAAGRAGFPILTRPEPESQAPYQTPDLDPGASSEGRWRGAEELGRLSEHLKVRTSQPARWSVR